MEQLICIGSKGFDGLAPKAVIPAKAGIQALFLGPRFRGDDDQRKLGSANANQVPRRGAPIVESVILRKLRVEE